MIGLREVILPTYTCMIHVSVTVSVTESVGVQGYAPDQTAWRFKPFKFEIRAADRLVMSEHTVREWF